MIDGQLGVVSKENPAFMSVNLYESPEEYRGQYDKPYAHVTVAVTSVNEYEGQRMLTMAILEPGEQLQASNFRKVPGQGDYVSCSDTEIDGMVLEPTFDLGVKYDAFRKMHDEAPYQVTGSLYSETPVYFSYDKNKQFPRYPVLESTTKTWDLQNETLQDGSKIGSLKDAEKWVLENHPAYIQGIAIMQKCPSGSFFMSAVPNPEYPEGEFETYEGRMKYAEKRAMDLGVEIGKERAEDVLAAQRQGRALPNTPTEEAGKDSMDFSL